jgi:hypothetical protein
MQSVRICPGCEQRLHNAADAIRHHAALMSRGVSFSRAEHPREELHQLKANLEATFNEAQAAWDAYRDHLIEHGILPPLQPSTQP